MIALWFKFSSLLGLGCLASPSHSAHCCLADPLITYSVFSNPPRNRPSLNCHQSQFSNFSFQCSSGMYVSLLPLPHSVLLTHPVLSSLHDRCLSPALLPFPPWGLLVAQISTGHSTFCPLFNLYFQVLIHSQFISCWIICSPYRFQWW